MSDVPINNSPILNSGVIWYKRASFQRVIFILFAIIPAYGGYLLFTIYPNILSIYYSLLKWDGVNTPQFIGLDNYIGLFIDSYVWRALYHNLLLLLTIPILTMLISLIIAYLLTYKRYREAVFYKVFYFLPVVLSTVVIGLMWSFIYDGDYGVLNLLLKLIGIDNGNLYWLGNTKTALWALVPPALWGGVGFYIIIFTNAMGSIPKSLYEAAILEGATHTTRLFKITIPLIWGVARVCFIFMVLGVIQGFDLILILTNGGPEGSTDVIGLYMFTVAFGDPSGGIEVPKMFGYASAIGMFLFIILVGINILVNKFLPNEGIEY